MAQSTQWGQVERNPQPPDHQSDVHPTEPPRPALSGPTICHSTSTFWAYHQVAERLVSV